MFNQNENNQAVITADFLFFLFFFSAIAFPERQTFAFARMAL